MSSGTIANIPPEKLLEIYQLMLRSRLFEERVYFLFLQGILPGTVHQSQGQEAAEVGICAALRRDDFVAPTHRGHGTCMAKGMSIASAMAELFAKKTGCCQGRGGSMHLADATHGIIPATAVIGESMVLTTGMGLAFKKQGTDRVAAAFFGDGGSNSGSFHEGLNMAAIWKLPVIYVCTNNLYGASTAVNTMVPVENISVRAAGYGIPGVTVDGMDVLAVYQAAMEAVTRARAGGGPTFIECKTYRYVGHSRMDACNYRTKEELNYWKSRDPIPAFRAQLVQAGVISDAEAEEIVQAIKAEVEASVEKAQKDPDPDPQEVFANVYA